MIQRTLVVLKPDAVKRWVSGEIISRFERVGLKIVGMKMVQPNKDFWFHHYETIGTMITRRGQKAFDMTLDMVAWSPVIAMVLEGVESVQLLRKMVGATEPKSAAPGTIRWDYAHVSFGYADSHNIWVANLVHASGDETEAKAEIAHWFKEEELY